MALRHTAGNHLRAYLRSGGFSPYDLGPLLIAWWSADALASLALSGSQVTDWTDIAGNLTLSQAVSGSRPLYSATSFNGSPGVTFDATDDNLETTDNGNLPTGGNASIVWAVASQDLAVATTGIRALFAYAGTANATRRSVNRTIVSSVNRLLIQVGNGTSAVGLTGSSVDLTGRHLIVASFGTATESAQVDTTSEGSTAAIPATTTGRVRMGATNSSSAAAFWGGPVRDIIVTGALTGAQYTALQTYLLALRNP